MKRKLLVLLSFFVITALSLTACFSQDNTPPADESDEIVVYSESVKAAVVVNMSGGAAALDYANLIKDAINTRAAGVASTAYDTFTVPDGTTEILIGKTNRSASHYAESELLARGEGAPEAFAICCKDGAVAILGTNDLTLRQGCEYFIETYVIRSTLTMKRDFLLIKELDPALELQATKEAELAMYDKRWEEIEAKLPGDVVDALKRYYSIYSVDILKWFASLYDSEIGAFYYSNSARDYNGFLPDIESTHQVLKDMIGAGCFNIYKDGDSIVKGMPKEMRDKIVAFVQAMQDPDDGYFYHTQWGKNIGIERRDRDLSWAIAIFNRLDADFLYPTALDRLQGATDTAAVIADMISKTSPCASLPTYLQSREAFYAWLDQKDFKKDSHGNGHTVGSMANQIEAAGLLDDAIEYFDKLQTEVYEEMKKAYDADPVNNPVPTGLWQKEVNYTSLSGLFKIGILYDRAKAPIKYADLALKSAIKCILSDEDPKTVIYGYNPWSGLGTAINSIKRANTAAKNRGEALPYDYDAAYAELLENAVEMINKTTEKFLLFQKEDGSFSYYQDYAAPTTQGTYVSLGVNEGDVNGTTVAMDGAASIFGALGVTRPQLWTATDLDTFFEIIESSVPIEKITPSNELTRDFENAEDGGMDEMMVFKGDTPTTGTIADPTKAGNRVFRLDYPGKLSNGHYLTVNTNYSASDAYLFEADYYMESGSNSITHQIQIKNASGAVYMLTFAISGNNVIIDDASTINGGAKTSGMSITVPLKTWFKLGVELYSDGTVDGFKAKIYIDGVCRFISSNFYGAHSAGTMPQRGFSSVQFYTMRNPASSLLIDNIHTDVLTGKTFDDSDLGVGPSVGEDEGKKNYDFEKSASGATILQNYPGSQNEILADPTGKGHGNVLKVTKSNTDTGLTDDYRFDSPAKKGSDKLVFSMDLYIDKLSFADTSYMAMYQITVGNLSNPTYMMTIMYNNSTGKLYLGDASSTGAGNANTFDGAVIELDRWYNIKVVVDILGKTDSFSATLYLDGVAVGESKNFYGSHNSSASPTGDFKYVNIRVQRRVMYEVYLDNVVIDFE